MDGSVNDRLRRSAGKRYAASGAHHFGALKSELELDARTVVENAAAVIDGA
jgi:hypothetical protein